MSLNNQQIERYARQIIVPGFGGVGQERLLAARLMVAGKAADIAMVVAYMAGAGVGEIGLRIPLTDAAAGESLIRRALALNPDVVVKPAVSFAGAKLVLAIGAEPECSELLTELRESRMPVIFARLNEPASVAIIPNAPPCLACADADLLDAPLGRGINAALVTMIAASEALKTLAGLGPAAHPALLQFNGFACTRRELRQRPLRAPCGCF